MRFFAGEHDASLDRGEAYLEVFGGALHYTFDHKGVHFIVLDNTSQPAPVLGEAQLDWLRKDLARRPKEAPIVVLTHRPLFAALPAVGLGDARRRCGDRVALRARERHGVLRPHPSRAPSPTGHIDHHAALAVMFPLSPVGTAPQKTQLPWDAAQPFKGLGWRSVDVRAPQAMPRERTIATG